MSDSRNNSNQITKTHRGHHVKSPINLMTIPACVQLSFCFPVHLQSYCGIVVLAGSYLKQRPESPELQVIDAPSLVDLRALAMAIEEKRTTIATKTDKNTFFILIYKK